MSKNNRLSLAEIVQSKEINGEKNQNPSEPHFRGKLTFREEVYRYTMSKQLQKDILSFFPKKKKIFKTFTESVIFLLFENPEVLFQAIGLSLHRPIRGGWV